MTGTFVLGMNVKLPDLLRERPKDAKKVPEDAKKAADPRRHGQYWNSDCFIHKTSLALPRWLIFTRQIERYEGCKVQPTL